MNLLLISSSNVYGYGYLDHPEPEIKRFLEGRGTVGFIPFAIKDHEAYVAKVKERLGAMGLEVKGVREPSDMLGVDAIFVGGGNTWRLLNALYETRLFDQLRSRVQRGLPYVGSSAGTNIAAPTIKTTNDMPIIQPPTFASFGFVPYQINPHYLDPEPDSKHKGETREQRILEFLEENDTPVVGLREGTMLRVENGSSTLLGLYPARLFRPGQEPLEVPVGSVIEEHLAK